MMVFLIFITSNTALLCIEIMWGNSLHDTIQYFNNSTYFCGIFPIYIIVSVMYFELDNDDIKSLKHCFTITDFHSQITDQFQYIKIQPKTVEALGNKYRVCGVYSPEPRAEVCCFRLNFNILSKLVYYIDQRILICWLGLLSQVEGRVKKPTVKLPYLFSF